MGPSHASEAVRATVDDEAWLQAMLDVEAALAAAGADVGLVSRAAAEAVAACCHAERFDGAELGRRAATAGNPIIPLVAELRMQVPTEAAAAVHLGATSQDIIDTSLMLLASRALRLLDASLAAAIDAAAALAERYRGALMPGRTLLQHAVPITFGLTAATWTVGLVDAAGGFGPVGRRAAGRSSWEARPGRWNPSAGTVRPWPRGWPSDSGWPILLCRGTRREGGWRSWSPRWPSRPGRWARSPLTSPRSCRPSWTRCGRPAAPGAAARRPCPTSATRPRPPSSWPRPTR